MATAENPGDDLQCVGVPKVRDRLALPWHRSWPGRTTITAARGNGRWQGTFTLWVRLAKLGGEWTPHCVSDCAACWGVRHCRNFWRRSAAIATAELCRH